MLFNFEKGSTGAHQCCRFSRNVAYVIPEIGYVYYLKIKITGAHLCREKAVLEEAFALLRGCEDGTRCVEV